MTQPTAPTRPRPYRSARRAEQAAQTRAAVLASAASLFARRGWSAPGMRDVAREAGVAVETVYASFRSKVDLLIAAIDVEVVGDADPVPLAERQQFAALATGSFDDRVASAARLVTQIHERTAGLHLALRQGAASEPGLADALVAGEQRRRQNVQQAAELVAGQRVGVAEADALWAVLSVDVFRLLTAMSGWSLEQYQRWAAAEIARRLPGATA
jgi:AcrR family transcriptional regulator